MMAVNPDHTDVGFLNHSLAYFDTRDFNPPKTSVSHVAICR
jgi:hypothetical protein